MDRTSHILIVDDDREIRDLLSRFLSKHGLRVSTAANGREMAAVLDGGAIDLIVLDLMMPGEDGLTLTRNLRANSAAQGGGIPIIMLTAMGEETDRIIGLEMGADDYLAKPFNPRELLARIKAVVRRFSALPTSLEVPGEGGGDGLVTFAGWTFNIAVRELTNPDGDAVILSGGEFELLQAFISHPGRVLNRDQLLDLARGRDAQPFDRAIDVQVSRLRKKIEPDPKKPTYIKTVRGGGYMFTPTVTGPTIMGQASAQGGT
ncbi:response regulator [Magnetovibrio blakemorei]|uniref:Regulatory protein VirG n=1 Tax=Magnetovibrio blakemorei TaxID=28181 RepID=A0A1E5QAG3_9PROT|nr:response regulator [Magnetovibrio blakemorei]OEJ68909.1 DNA-binding response regulator [Magnetovibrio blakemorei]